MKTKAQIVQELLDKKLINAEDAVVLLMNVEKEYVYVPIQQAQPLSPNQRGYDIYCGSHSTNNTIN